MKRFLFIMLVTVAAISAAAASLNNESLKYNVSYKWGLVQKNAGTAVLNLKVNGNNCRATLYARTDPWADKFYKLRDTLISNFSSATMVPTEYQRIAHEDGRYAHDIVKFSRNGNTYTGNCTVYRQGKNESKPTKTSRSLSANGLTVDMVSAFYYLRTLDFGAMSDGNTQTINIFSGKKKELLKITYKGKTSVKINGKDREAYHVKFTFTSDGRKESSAPIDAWISADARRIPLKLEGSLKIGKIRCIYAGG